MSLKDLFKNQGQKFLKPTSKNELGKEIESTDLLEAYVADYTSTLTANAPLSIRAAKASINELVRDVDVRDMERARRLTSACYDSSDYEEGRTAFMEKRAPKFTGR